MQTLADARQAYFVAASGKGSTCPCCSRFGKVYKRKFNSSMAAVLVLIYRFRSRGYVHAQTLINSTSNAAVAAAIRGDFAKLRYWGLILDRPQTLEDKKHSGFWTITPEGCEFVLGQSRVKEYVFIYNTKALGFDGHDINIHQALKKRFSYTEIDGRDMKKEGKKISKTAFVLGLPSDMAAADVVEKAKAAGIKLNPKYVYVIRSQAKGKNGEKKASKRGRKPAVAASNGNNGHAKIDAEVETEETSFNSLVANIGLTRAQALIDAARTRASA